MWQETTNRPTKLCVTRVTAGINAMMWQSTTTITPHELDATVREEVEGNTGAGIKRYAHPYLYFLTPFQLERGGVEPSPTLSACFDATRRVQHPPTCFQPISTRTGSLGGAETSLSVSTCFDANGAVAKGAPHFFFFLLFLLTNLTSGEVTTPPRLFLTRFEVNGQG